MKAPKIRCAAVRYQLMVDKGTDKFQTIEGYSHSDCYTALSFMGLYENKRNMEVEEEGFLLEDGTFVNRFKAMGIALHNNQVKSLYTNGYPLLYSYMLKEH